MYTWPLKKLAKKASLVLHLFKIYEVFQVNGHSEKDVGSIINVGRLKNTEKGGKNISNKEKVTETYPFRNQQ